jgi:hypothetical protein
MTAQMPDNGASLILPVTVAVPVRNEEANLARCLERLGRFAEIVVIDSGSTDRTRQFRGMGIRRARPCFAVWRETFTVGPSLPPMSKPSAS